MLLSVEVKVRSDESMLSADIGQGVWEKREKEGWVELKCVSTLRVCGLTRPEAMCSPWVKGEEQKK